MNTIALEFATEEEVRAAADKLWNKHGITGELEMFQTSSGLASAHLFRKTDQRKHPRKAPRQTGPDQRQFRGCHARRGAQ